MKKCHSHWLLHDCHSKTSDINKTLFVDWMKIYFSLHGWSSIAIPIGHSYLFCFTYSTFTSCGIYSHAFEVSMCSFCVDVSIVSIPFSKSSEVDTRSLKSFVTQTQNWPYLHYWPWSSLCTKYEQTLNEHKERKKNCLKKFDLCAMLCSLLMHPNGFCDTCNVFRCCVLVCAYTTKCK